MKGAPIILLIALLAGVTPSPAAKKQPTAVRKMPASAQSAVRAKEVSLSG